MERNRRLRREGVKPGESEKTVMQNFSIRRRTTRSPTPHPVTCGFSSALCGQQPIRPGSTYSGGLRQPPALSFCTPRPSIIAAPLPPDITSPVATHLDRQSNLAATTEHKLAFTCHTKNYQFVRICSQIDHCPCVHTLYYPLTVQRCTTIQQYNSLFRLWPGYRPVLLNEYSCTAVCTAPAGAILRIVYYYTKYILS